VAESVSILVTGAKGFIGRNLVATLRTAGYTDIFECDADTTPSQLDAFCSAATFVYHLAGVNRPQDTAEFMAGNCGFTATLLSTLKRRANYSPIVFASSAQAALDNPYGKSKQAAEDLLLSHSSATGARVHIYRLPNVFGKWCRPNYNSAVATFCHNIALGLPITMHNPETELKLVYVDDVVDEFVQALRREAQVVDSYCSVSLAHIVTLGALADLLYAFRDGRHALTIPNLNDAFTKQLYATYLSYLPAENFAYPLTMHSDARGSFTEVMRTVGQGQFSVNITKPGITKGNHWHHTKHEKFLVVNGCGVIRLRAVGSESVISFAVSGEKLEIVDIPPGYTHNIENTGEDELVTLMWASEPFDPKRPDTFMMQVQT